jgi:hypothetical protein
MELERVAVVTLLLLAAALAVAWWWARGRVGRHNRQRQRRAARGERDAEALLTARGFTVIDRQVTGRWVLYVDDDAVDVSCRADLLVEARRHATLPRGTRYIADVKTGNRAPDPTHPATRRQLLEYRLVFDVDGVLLVDMEAQEVREVRFGPLDD